MQKVDFVPLLYEAQRAACGCLPLTIIHHVFPCLSCGMKEEQRKSQTWENTGRRKRRMRGSFQRERFSTGNNLHAALRHSRLQDWQNFFPVPHMEDTGEEWNKEQKSSDLLKLFNHEKTSITTISGVFHHILQYISILLLSVQSHFILYCISRFHRVS